MENNHSLLENAKFFSLKALISSRTDLSSNIIVIVVAVLEVWQTITLCGKMQNC
jgi:hypothetical protein